MISAWKEKMLEISTFESYSSQVEGGIKEVMMNVDLNSASK